MSIAQRVASRWLAAKRQRRQKGIEKIKRRRRYRQERSKVKRESARYRAQHPSATKRYQKRYRKNPRRYQRRRASILAFQDTPFIDLEHGMEGEVEQIDLSGDLVQTTLDGQPKEYGLWDFLDTVVFPTEEGEDDFLGRLDTEFEWADDDADDDGVSDEEDDDFDLGFSDDDVLGPSGV